MTLTEAYTMALKRVGLDETSTTFKDQMRLYLNMGAKELGALADWWWLYKQGTLTTTHTVTVKNISGGSFAVGNTITDGTNSGTIAASYDVTNAPTIIHYTTSKTTDFSGTLSVGGVSSTVVSDVVTRQYQLASDVLSPYSWRDETNNRVLAIASWDEMDEAAPDQNETGDARWIIPEGADSNTGNQLVAVFPLHDTSNETFRYRYYAYIPDWTSDDDSTALDGWIPQPLQPALVYTAAALYQQEKGDDDGAQINRQEADRQVDRALRVNSRMWGNRHRARSHKFGGGSAFGFFVQEGSLSA